MLKYIVFAILLLVLVVQAATLRVSACKRDVCTDYVLSDVKSYHRLTNFEGNPFIRVVFYNNSLLDINGDTFTLNGKPTALAVR